MEKIERRVLDHGKVVLLDVFGSDARIVEAARGSYGRGTKRTRDDRGLLRYLMRNRHTSPFEMAEVLFYLKIPITVARQLVRHRTANLNEMSGRYSVMSDDIYVPVPSDCGPQSSDNKQGRSPVEGEDAHLRATKAHQTMAAAAYSAYETYDSLLNVSHVSREIARGVLPLHSYTEMYWKCDLHNLFHFLHLRLHKHAQKEICVVAEAMSEAIRPHFPWSWEAFTDYVLRARTLSAMEQILLADMLNGNPPTKDRAMAVGMSTREYTEFIEYVEHLRKLSSR